jgi:NAD+ kinase
MKKVAVFGHYYEKDSKPILNDIFSFFDEKQLEFVIEKGFYDILIEKKVLSKSCKTFSSYQDLDNSFDFLLSIGGDGTILRASTFIRDLDIPILGINAGRLGFLAKVQKENVGEFLLQIIEGKYKITERTTIKLETTPVIDLKGQADFALNEITVNRRDTTSMITIETYLNDEYLTSYWADGLIISTPTGSTGYSLSCGGPILTPNVNSLVITPIAPHNLNARPLVINDDMIVKLKVSGREDTFLVSLDSRLIIFNHDTELIIKKNSFPIKLIEPLKESFFATIRTKLLFGADKRN